MGVAVVGREPPRCTVVHRDLHGSSVPIRFRTDPRTEGKAGAAVVGKAVARRGQVGQTLGGIIAVENEADPVVSRRPRPRSCRDVAVQRTHFPALASLKCNRPPAWDQLATFEGSVPPRRPVGPQGLGPDPLVGVVALTEVDALTKHLSRGEVVQHPYGGVACPTVGDGTKVVDGHAFPAVHARVAVTDVGVCNDAEGELRGGRVLRGEHRWRKAVPDVHPFTGFLCQPAALPEHSVPG